jgi:hypothetical protein
MRSDGLVGRSRGTRISENGVGAVRAVLLVGLLAIAAFVVWLILPPTSAGLPPGATRLELQTQATRPGARLVLACPAAAFPDLLVGVEGSVMTFTRVGGSGGAETSTNQGGRVEPVWPPGWSARLLSGRAELLNPEGAVVAWDGDVIRGLGGGGGLVCLPIGDTFRVDRAT